MLTIIEMPEVKGAVAGCGALQLAIQGVDSQEAGEGFRRRLHALERERGPLTHVLACVPPYEGSMWFMFGDQICHPQ